MKVWEKLFFPWRIPKYESDSRDTDSIKCVQVDMDKIEKDEQYVSDMFDEGDRPAWMNRKHKSYKENLYTPAIKREYTNWFFNNCGLPVGAVILGLSVSYYRQLKDQNRRIALAISLYGGLISSGTFLLI